MTGGSLFKNMWLFCLPLIATNLLQMLFNAADTIVVGRFSGQQALAAVGATGSLCFLLVALFNGLSIGTNVVVARFLGADDEKKVVKAVHTSMILAVISGAITALLGYFISRPMLELMSTPADIIDQSELYMRIYFFAMFFGIIYNFGAAVLRAKGDTKRPLYFLLASGMTNVVLNVVFVVVFHLSVAGVAIATAISQALSALLVLYVMFHEKDCTKLEIANLKIDGQILKHVISIGLPAGIQSTMFSLSNVIVQSSINSFDSSVIVAGNSAAANIEDFVYIVSSALTQACITFTSQCIGAGRKDRIRSIMYLTMVMAVASTIILGFSVWYFGDIFMGFYTEDAAVVEVGKVRLFWVSMMLFLNITLDVYISSMRGMAYSIVPTISMIVGICGIRLMWLFFIFPHFRQLSVIYMCFPVSWIVTSVLEGILWKLCYRRTVG